MEATLLKEVLLLTILIAGVFCNNDDITVGQLPPQMMEEFVALYSAGCGNDVTEQCEPSNMISFNAKDSFADYSLIGRCKPPQQPNATFLLYTRSNPTNPIALNPTNPSQIDPAKKLVLLIHGWISGATAYGFPELKDAYLKRYDCNLVILDWSSIAKQLYTKSFCDLPAVAQKGADVLCRLSSQYQMDPGTMHIVGHSLGAHLAGYIGQYMQNQCGTVGRITGLDPAGPLYQGTAESKRLDPTDAAFVDVVHTNSLEWGYYGNIGTVDFHVSCGSYQPSCPNFNLGDIKNTAVSIVCCNHLRALDYMAESVNSAGFRAKSCSGCPAICQADILKASFATMGEDCSTKPPGTTYWVPTKTSAPYAQGCAPFSSGCS